MKGKIFLRYDFDVTGATDDDDDDDNDGDNDDDDDDAS